MNVCKWDEVEISNTQAEITKTLPSYVYSMDMDNLGRLSLEVEFCNLERESNLAKRKK